MESTYHKGNLFVYFSIAFALDFEMVSIDVKGVTHGPGPMFSSKR